jgi:hypothetical protein
MYSFSTDYYSMGKLVTVDFIENGRDVFVNEANKKQYVE